jgi:hypothetical protein
MKLKLKLLFSVRTRICSSYEGKWKFCSENLKKRVHFAHLDRDHTMLLMYMLGCEIYLIGSRLCATMACCRYVDERCGSTQKLRMY